MKTKIKVISLFLMLCIGTCATSQKVSAQGGSVTYQVFYDDLSPYGNWVNYNNYGYVWVPDVDAGFTPYSTNGYWVYTEDGWTWVSNYSWGWAPFHYGRWYTDVTYGPVWIPGNEWGPGWVNWRGSDNFYGWAPMGPDGFGGTYNAPYNQWTFVRNGDLGRTNINNYYISNANNVTIINNSTVINNRRVDKTRNITYNAGPNKSDVEKHAGKTFTPVTIKESNKPGQNMNKNELQMYRPQVQKNSASAHKPVPSKVANVKEVKPIKQRSAVTPTQKAIQPTKQQPVQTKAAGQQKSVQTKPAGQQNQQRPVQTKPAWQQNQQKQVQTKPAGQQNHQKPVQTKPVVQQNKQQATQHQPTGQENKQQQPQQQPAGQQNKEQPSQPQHNNPPKNVE